MRNQFETRTIATKQENSRCCMQFTCMSVGRILARVRWSLWILLCTRSKASVRTPLYVPNVGYLVETVPPSREAERSSTSCLANSRYHNQRNSKSNSNHHRHLHEETQRRMTLSRIERECEAATYQNNKLQLTPSVLVPGWIVSGQQIPGASSATGKQDGKCGPHLSC